MKKRPSAIWHMIKWGIYCGFILSFLYSISFSNAIIVILVQSVAISALSIYVGACMGFVLLHFVLQIPKPFTYSDISEQQEKILPIVFFLLFSAPMFITLVVFLSTSMMFSNTYELLVELRGFFIAFVFPTLVMSICYTFAAHRYLLRLHHWSKSVHARKSKAKNDELYMEKS